MRHPARLGVALAALALTAVSCSSSRESSGDRSAEKAASRTTTVTSCGRKLSFDEPPKRAVTLDQSATETLLELGLADHMAGTANLKTKIAKEYQDAYAKVPVLSPKILTGEQLRAATPDLVVASFDDLYAKDRVGTREELAELDLPSYVSAVECPKQNAPDKTPFDLLFDDYTNYGKIFDAEDRAEKLVDEQRAVVDKAAETAEQVEGEPTVVWFYSVYNGLPYVAGKGGLPSEMSRLVGAKNAFDDVDEEWPEVSWEQIADRDPDFIVIGDLSERGAPGDSAEEKLKMMREDAVVSKLTAVQKNRIIEVPGIEMDPSVRTTHTLRLLIEGMKDLGYAR
ncbi:ABC transporter substrate-binding protein [Streptomyces thermodiastaticus]|uniref:ABC transporter substrate-binding protein n=1 Tax=Streptomyces thermoviolaceus subsp. thermoviolaceus TaxID=66860 RepID=A0ABX0YSV8_STRTL|nr:ABC transporter substrate-binding protein [Streptomyces thermoviolaceus]NJP15662.1 ABC transporter substrate-binding protein [Streptomyces thermoviolaceus subsp. thermoviolaceus]WTD46767.1 ABC transporter substrate-binding protein [Streptomyces thermoviolaceus]GHA95841.1 ABC transporter substrate-binding protein [Streptomyces thermoviolaceus subsp. thermoviolaceus]